VNVAFRYAAATAAVDKIARNAASAADGKAQSALDEINLLRDLAHQDRVFVAQIADPENLPNSGGPATEASLIPIVAGHKKVDIAAGRFEPASARNLHMNFLDPTKYRTSRGTGVLTSTTFLGEPAYNFQAPNDDDMLVYLDSEPFTAAAGDTFHLAFLIEPVAGLPDFRLMIYHDDVRQGSLEYVHFDLTTGFGTGLGTGDSYWEDPVGKLGTYVHNFGNGIYAVHMELTAKTGITDSFLFSLEINSTDAATEHNVLFCYFGLTQVLLDASDGTEILMLPHDTETAEYQLTPNSDQSITVSDGFNYTLVLPSAPSSDVRDLVVRATITDGSLALPASGAKAFGEAGPFSADVRITVRQYGDGSDADIYAVTEAV